MCIYPFFRPKQNYSSWLYLSSPFIHLGLVNLVPKCIRFIYLLHTARFASVFLSSYSSFVSLLIKSSALSPDKICSQGLTRLQSFFSLSLGAILVSKYVAVKNCSFFIHTHVAYYLLLRVCIREMEKIRLDRSTSLLQFITLTRKQTDYGNLYRFVGVWDV